MSANRDSKGRFPPGQSGNRNGRPRKGGTVDGAVRRALATKVTIVKDGKRRRVSKLEVTAEQLVNKGASGDLRGAKLAIDMARQAELRAEADTLPDMSLLDREIADRIIERLKRILTEGTQP